MNLIKVGAGILNQTPLDWEGNYSRITKCIKQARQKKVSILCLPELCITGYGCEDAFFSPNTIQKSLDYLRRIVPHSRDMIVTVGLPISMHNKLYNCACLIVNGKILGFVAKKFLAGNGIHYEPRWFSPWLVDGVDTIEVGGQTYPIGDLYFDVGGVKLGFEICEDAWVANRPGRELYQYGVDLILNPSASHFAFDKVNVRKRFVLEGSRAFGVTYVYSNLIGNESGRAIFDGGAMIASNGSLLALGKRLTFVDSDVTTAVVDLDIPRLAQMQMHTLETPVDFGECILYDFDFPDILPKTSKPKEPNWETSTHIKEEEFSRAMMLGLFDYLRKSHSKGFVISLSGGADSASIACMTRLMVDCAIEELGLVRFLEKLSYIKDIEDMTTADEIAKYLITTAYQSTQNSGEVTLKAAKSLAEAINVTFYHLNIDTIVEEYKRVVSESIGRELNWEEDDITLQNIQARTRAPSIWMYANLNNALLLSTSNRSEAAVGYATMDGDTAGGLSPIAGIDKAFLRQWLRWLETKGLKIKDDLKDDSKDSTKEEKSNYTIPALSYVNDQQPTAELRPKSSKQTDEDDLMPYPILDDIEGFAIRDKRSPSECFYLLKAKHPTILSKQLKNYVDKFFKLWCRNQWKRERYAPSFHLDDKNLDPKTWCRFPILSSGYQKELEELFAIED